MSIPSASMRIATGTGNGIITAFDGAFKIFSTSDLAVYLETAVANVFTLQTLTTHYTVAFDSDANTFTVTFLTAPASGRRVQIFGAIAQTQPTTFPREGVTPAATTQAAFDRVAAHVLELEEKVRRAILQKKVPAQPTAIELPLVADRASKYLAFDSSGNPIAASTITGGTSATAFVQTLLDDATAPAFLATIRGGLDSEASIATDDEVILYDTSEAAYNKALLSDVLKVINALTADAAPVATTDYVVTYDASAAAAKKVLLSALVNSVAAPTKQYLTSGTAYTTPTGCRKLIVKMTGGGGGGGASATNAGAVGGDTSFNSIVAGGGSGGGAGVGAHGAGGTGGAGSAAFRRVGGRGANMRPYNTTAAGIAGAANSGIGGGGGVDGVAPGGSGGNGEYAEFAISSPAASYTYAIGAGGAGGAAGGQAGAAGGSGFIEVEEYY